MSDTAEASANSFVSLNPTNPEGSISGVFDGIAGQYRVELIYFDENDGNANLTVTVADTVTPLTLDQRLSDSDVSPLSHTRQTTHEAIALQTGDRFTITGQQNQQEFARIDAIVFTPIESAGPSITTTAPPSVLEELTDPQPAPSASETSLTNSATLQLESPMPEFLTDVVDLTNQFRAEHGLDPVVFDASLAAAAQTHANHMAQYEFFSHAGLGNSTPLSRAEAAGYQAEAIAENIGAGYDTPEAMVHAWISSASHRANLLNPTQDAIGVGYAVSADQAGSLTSQQEAFQLYWTQLLGTENG